jgi:TolB-like protein/DNA-binding winged helix-turn-helix (wHTH) protein/tetratricopeptide (TPR) repeat protein
MRPLPPDPASVRFGPFDLDLRTGDLHEDGQSIKLQAQPARILALLVRRAGHIVTREEMRAEVWGASTWVDFEHSINFCIRQIRAALRDDADHPCYVETLPRRGYRFVAAVEPVPAETDAPAAAPSVRGRRRYLVALGIAVPVALVVGGLAWTRRSAPAGGVATVAVLPFHSLDAGADRQYLTEGLTEEIAGQLSRSDPQRLRVIAMTSVMQYRGTSKRASRIGRELEADYLVEGSVTATGDRVRIRARLVDAASETQVWAGSHDGELTDVRALERAVAGAVAREVGVSLAPHRGGPIETVNREAYEACLRGRFHLRKLTRASAERAIAEFQRSLAADPAYAPAYAGLADAYYSLSNMQLDPHQAMSRVRAAARQALELDEYLAEAHVSLALVQAFYDWDWPGAEAEFTRALELDPGAADARMWFGVFLSLTGRMDQSLVELTRARRLDPLSLAVNSTLSLPLYLLGRHDEAIAQLQRTLELDPGYVFAHLSLGSSYEAKRDYTRAIDAFERAQRLDDSPEILAFLARAHAVSGDRAKARRLLDDLMTRGSARYVSPHDVALVHAGLGERERALDWLERAYEAHAEGMVSLKVDPRFAELRSSPRFQSLIARLGLDRVGPS